MAINLGAAYVDIVPSTGKLAGQLKSQLGEPLAKAGTSAGQGFTQRFSAGFRSLASSLGSMVSSAITGAAGVAAAGLGTALFTGWQRVTTIQDATSALTISLGDATKAAGVLDDVIGVVTGTPYNLDQFAAAAQQLIGFGVDAQKVPGYLTAIGEAAATQGGRAGEFASRLSTVFGQIAASGQVSLADIWRISDAGVNALAILANHFGVTREEMKKMVSSGAVPATEALDALSKGILEGSDGAAGATTALAGTMEALRETLSGAAGGFRSALARFGGSIITPLAGALTVGFTAAAGVLDALGKKVGSALEAIGDSPGFKAFVGFLESVPDLIGPALSRLGELGPLLAPLAGAFGAAGLSGLAGVLGPLGKLLPTINPILGAIAAFVAATPELRDAFMEVVSVVGGALGDAFQTLIEGLAPSLPSISDALVTVGEALADLVIALAPTIPLLADLAVLLIETIGVPAIEAIAWAVGQLASALVLMGPAFPIIITGLVGVKVAMVALTAVMNANPIVLLASALAALAFGLVWAYQNVDWFRGAIQAALGVVTTFVSGVADVAAVIWNIGGAIVNWFRDLPGTIGRAADAVASWFGRLPRIIGDALSAVVGWFTRLPGNILSALGSFASTIGDWFVTGITNLPKALGIAIGAVVVAIVSIPILALQGLWSFGNWLWTEWLGPAITALPGLIADAFTATINWFKALPGNILSAIGNLASTLRSTGSDLISGFWNGITSLAVSVMTWFRNLPGNIVTWIGNVTSRLYNIGWNLIVGLWNGIWDRWVTLYGWITRLPGNIVSLLSGAANWLWNIGRDVVWGLIRGISSMATTLWRSMTDFISRNLPGPVKWVLGISSPSKLFAEFGVNSAEGLIVGLKSMERPVAAAAVDLAGAVAQQPPTLAIPQLGPAPAPPAPDQGEYVGMIDGDVLVRFMRKENRKRGGALLPVTH